MRRLLRNRTVIAGLHVLVILGLLASLVANLLHQRYMTRGMDLQATESPIPHTDHNPLGVNTFLHEEVNPERVEQTLDMIADAGFSWVRQIFVWSDIERAPGVYFDENQDVSTWDKYDRIMRLAAERGLDVIVRLDKPPVWAQEERGNVEDFPDGPPDDYQDYGDFVATVVDRYQGQINYVQLWNEPNLTGEWGGQPIDPAEFTELLAVGYDAVKSVDPDVQVLMPGLAPNDQTGPENLSDLLFLEGMYEAGAADYFDIAAVMIYGYGYSPWDRRVAFERNNFSRVIQTREIMEEYGDHETPVWAVEYGWVSLPDDWDGDPSPWGEPVTEEEQATYLYEGYLRAQREWPWMGPMMIWAFRWATDPEQDDQRDNPTRGFRIVGHDFQARPAYDLLARNAGRLDRAHLGSYTAQSRYVLHGDDWSLANRDGVEILQPETANASLEIPFSGTGIELNLEGEGGILMARVDGDQHEISADNLADGTYRIAGLPDESHLLELSVVESGSNPLALSGFSVVRRTLIFWIYPWIYAAIAIVLLLNVASLTGTIFLRQNRQSAGTGQG
jgi:polysaccharide biosynthesis protein PslG